MISYNQSIIQAWLHDIPESKNNVALVPNPENNADLKRVGTRALPIPVRMGARRNININVKILNVSV